MKEITKLMINEYKINQLKMDFMGYSLQKNEVYTFHHLIVPKRQGGKATIQNGAILCGKSSHPYLHVIENTDHDMFLYITDEMIDENIKGYLDIENIRRIHDALSQFEKEYYDAITHKGKILIKEEYMRRKKM